MSYVQPTPKGVNAQGQDRGIDFQGKPGQFIVAIGRARIDAVKSDPGGYGTVVYYTLLDGRQKGTQIFVGHARPVASARKGQIIERGKPISVLIEKSGGGAPPGWVEIGIAKDGVPLYPRMHAASTPGGQALLSLLSGAATPTAPRTSPAPATPYAAPKTTGAPQTAAPGLTDVQNAQLSSDINSIPQADQGPPLADAPLEGDFVDTAVNPYGPGSTASTWQLIAQNGNVSPDTLRLAQMAQYGVNAPSP